MRVETGDMLVAGGGQVPIFEERIGVLTAHASRKHAADPRSLGQDVGLQVVQHHPSSS